MEVKILEDSKDDMRIEIDNLTIAEIMRVYLNKDSAVTFAAWRRNHPTENPVLAFKTKGKTTKKALSDAVALLEKDLDVLSSDFKKLK